MLVRVKNNAGGEASSSSHESDGLEVSILLQKQIHCFSREIIKDRVSRKRRPLLR